MIIYLTQVHLFALICFSRSLFESFFSLMLLIRPSIFIVIFIHYPLAVFD